jgi:hypothetical protein
MWTRRTLAVLACLMAGTVIGGVGHATVPGSTVRTCEEVLEGVLQCDDNTTCYYVNGVWICEPSQPPLP